MTRVIEATYSPPFEGGVTGWLFQATDYGLNYHSVCARGLAASKGGEYAVGKCPTPRTLSGCSDDTIERQEMPLAKRELVPVLILLALTLLCYSTSFHGQFVFDDQQVVLQNSQLMNIRTAGDVMSLGAGWRQLLLITYGLNYYWGGLDTFGYHALNVALHALNVLLVYWIILAAARDFGFRISDFGLGGEAGHRRFAALAGAAVFSVHTLFTMTLFPTAHSDWGNPALLQGACCAATKDPLSLFAFRWSRWVSRVADEAGSDHAAAPSCGHIVPAKREERLALDCSFGGRSRGTYCPCQGPVGVSLCGGLCEQSSCICGF